MNSERSSAFLYLFLIVGLLSFAFAPIMVRLAAVSNPVALAVWRTFFAVIAIGPFYVFQKKQITPSQQISKTKKNLLLISSGTLLGLHFILWISSLKYTSVASASVLVTIHPIILILVERLVFKVKFHVLVWIGVFISFLGSVGLSWADSLQLSGNFPDALFGDVLAFLAAVVFAIYFIISQKIRKHTSWLGYVAPIYFWAMLACVIAGFIMPGQLLLSSNQAWIMAILMALGPQLLGHGSMNYAVKYISPTVLATTILVEPAIATLLGIFLFNEMPTILAFTAMTTIIAGVFFTWLGNSKSSEK